ncbi:MAG: hypothetical protein A3G75_03365 [Verrucomicrobia bacterium RIFCSPLOWO2_12_FULL_64_8]|nr:MAG: hypothetical protein A3G75_03365 [Verrucomicrobia bacterium RIFCSPLOWO2_12_FULL_64_8]
MSTREPELKSPSPEEFSSASRTLFAVNLLVAVVVSLWIPLRIVYSRHAPHMAAADWIVDLTVLGLIAASRAGNSHSPLSAT